MRRFAAAVNVAEFMAYSGIVMERMMVLIDLCISLHMGLTTTMRNNMNTTAHDVRHGSQDFVHILTAPVTRSPCFRTVPDGRGVRGS